MLHWLRFSHKEAVGFGTLEEDRIKVFEGDMFGGAKSTGVTVGLEEVEIMMPCVPGHTRSGTISAAGANTKRRSTARGWGTIKSASTICKSLNNNRSRSSIRGAFLR